MNGKDKPKDKQPSEGTEELIPEEEGDDRDEKFDSGWDKGENAQDWPGSGEDDDDSDDDSDDDDSKDEPPEEPPADDGDDDDSKDEPPEEPPADDGDDDAPPKWFQDHQAQYAKDMGTINDALKRREPKKETKPPPKAELSEDMEKSLKHFEELDPEAAKSLRKGLESQEQRLARLESRNEERERQSETDAQEAKERKALEAAGDRLKAKHPDYLEIGPSKEFKDWTDRQSSLIQQARRSNDPDIASDVLDLYKKSDTWKKLQGKDEDQGGGENVRRKALKELSGGAEIPNQTSRGPSTKSRGSFDRGWDRGKPTDKKNR